MRRMGLVANRSLYNDFTDWRTTLLTSAHPQLSANMLFWLVQSSHLAGFSRYFTVISNGGAISRWMGLVASRSLYDECTDWRTTLLTCTHPQLSANMLFWLVQSSHLAGFSRYFTVISNGGAISRWMGRMDLVANRSLYDDCTDWRTTLLTSAHPQLSANILFWLVQSSHLAGFSRSFTVISKSGAISRWMGLVASRSLYDECTEWRAPFLTSPHPLLSANMLFRLVQSSHLVDFSRYFTVISNGGAISRWMGLLASRSLCDECTDWRTTLLTSPHPQLSANMLFGLGQSSHLAGFSRYFTVISNGGAISRWMGRMGLEASRSLYDECTDWRTTFLTSPHP